MEDDAAPAGAESLALLRHDLLRRTAPAVQHEINNAMMVLISNLDLLGRSAAEGAPRRQLDRAQEATRRLEETIRGFLDAARRPEEEPASVSPALALRQAAPLLRAALGARHPLGLPAAEGVWEARIDRARLDLALLSLARELATVLPTGAGIAATAVNRQEAGEVALALAFPEGIAAPPASLALLVAAAEATGGRGEDGAAGVTLVWARA